MLPLERSNTGDRGFDAISHPTTLIIRQSKLLKTIFPN